jgi:hypothetical protein
MGGIFHQCNAGGTHKPAYGFVAEGTLIQIKLAGFAAPRYSAPTRLRLRRSEAAWAIGKSATVAPMPL